MELKKLNDFLPRFGLKVVLACLCWLMNSHDVYGQIVSDSEVRIDPQFEMVQLADDSIATNIFSMTVSDQGNVYVSGPGYIRRLVDRDETGRYQSSQLVTHRIRSGAQGMCVVGNKLLAVGDQAVWEIDLNQTDRDPVKRLAIKTGGEHDAHAIRQGPFGWWYLIAGNGVPIKPDFHNSSSSPVKRPRAGFIMRISPDWSRREVVAHGFRNAYDFDFNQDGRLFTYDSDGERDISLPWYRPTRVFEILPGDDAGFVTPSWKRPHYYFDMPRLVGEAGRGSPTGVTVFDGDGLGKEYEQALFVADWTFGRILVSKANLPNRKRVEQKSNSASVTEGPAYRQLDPFAVAQGDFGFAVTDLAQSASGSLLVTVGGRGTRGGVYEIRKRTNRNGGPRTRVAERYRTAEKNLIAPGAWTADSKQKLNRLAQPGGFDAILASNVVGYDSKEVNDYLGILRESNVSSSEDVERLLLRHRVANDRFPRPGGDDDFESIAWGALLTELNAVVSTAEDDRFNADQFLRSLRRMQMIMEQGEAVSRPPVLHGFRCSFSAEDLEPRAEQELNQLASSALAVVCNQGDAFTVREFCRLMSMIQLDSTDFRLFVANQINATSHPVDDLFWLSCLAKVSNRPNRNQPFVRQQISEALVGLDKKLAERQLRRDRNWKPRVRELIRVLFRDFETAQTVVGHSEFGKKGHGIVALEAPGRLSALAATRIYRQVVLKPNQLDADSMLVLQKNAAMFPKSFFRNLAQNNQYEDLAIRALGNSPEPEDETLFAKGLLRGNARTVRICLNSLQKIRLRRPELVSVHVWQRLEKMNRTRQDPRLQDGLVVFLRRLTGIETGYELGQPGQDQTVAINAWRIQLAKRFPESFAKLAGGSSSIEINDLLTRVEWAKGEATRGKFVFEKLQCANCHSGGRRLGPDLAGISKRFSRKDLFAAIIDPHRDVANRYRATIVETSDGIVYRGASIYDSVDGITLLEASGETIRVNRDNIEQKRLSEQSVMPAGLLDTATSQEIADLYAFMREQ